MSTEIPQNLRDGMTEALGIEGMTRHPIGSVGSYSNWVAIRCRNCPPDSLIAPVEDTQRHRYESP